MLPESAIDSLLDLERQSLGPTTGHASGSGAVIPPALQQLLTGLVFVRSALWGPWCAGRPPGLLGLVSHEGRLWAIAAGCEAQLEQLTGAPLGRMWHEWGRGSQLNWMELDAAEAWRLGLGEPALTVHFRPPLGTVIGGAAPAEEPVAPADEPAAEPDLSLVESLVAESAPDAVFDSPSETAASAEDHAPDAELPVKILAAPDVADASVPLLSPPSREPIREPSRPPSAPRSRAARTPRLALPALPRLRLPRGRPAVAVAAGLVLALALALVLTREPIARAVVGRFTLSLVTSPEGATVRVDGELVPGRTPLTLPLEPGAHRIELAFGEYANSVFSVDGKRDERIERSIEWVGSLGLASADTSAGLTVAFDGRPWGTLPLWKDDVPVGRHRLSFSGRGVRPWEEEVQIKAGQSTRVTAEPVRVPPYGLVTARAERVTSEGVEDVDGAAVFVDGAQAGVTPTDLKLDPGPHSVRIRAGDAPSPVHLIEVQAGGRYFASTQFGRPAEPWVAFDPPLRLSLAKPHVLTVALAAEIPLPVREMWLWRKAGDAAYERFALSIVQIEGRTRGTLAFPTTGLKPGTRVSYYIAIKTREGEEYFSEVRALPVVP